MNVYKFPRGRRLVFLCRSFSAIMLAGCTVEPAAIDRQTMSHDLIQDRLLAQQDAPPLSGQLSLEEAIARAIKFNLDHRVTLMEQAVARGDFDLSRYDVLPSLLADAGYSTRSEPRLTRSVNAVTGEDLETDPTISADQSSWDFSANLSWSLLDFGVSYYGAQQNANRLLIAAQRRRRAMHLLVMDVHTAYWRAASAQALEPRIAATIQLTRAAIEDARLAQQGNAQAPMEHLRQERALLRTLRDMNQVQQDLVASRAELSNLINAPVDQPLELDPPIPLENRPRVLDEPMEVLERVALYHNADLKEHFYDVEIARLETRSALLHLMPDLFFSWGPRYTKDTFVLNKQWNEGALSVSYNLFSLLNISNVRKHAEAREELAHMRRIAMQMTVVAQVHLAALQARNALTRLYIAEELQHVEQEIELRMVNQYRAGTISAVELVGAQAEAIVADLLRYQALAGFHSSMGRLQASLGFEPNISSMQAASLDEIEREVSVTLKRWYAGAGGQSEHYLINQLETSPSQPN